MTKPQVFIIESLKFDDETHERFEGKFLSQILHLGGKKPLYYYIRTKKELEKVLRLFNESQYRYLHVSCHGNPGALFTTLDELPFSQLGSILQPYLNDKRLFVSACSAVNAQLAKVIIPGSGCYSLIGPKKDIGFHDAAIVWASFYHLAFKENPKAMKRKDLLSILEKITNTFEISLNYFSPSSMPPGYRKTLVKSK